MDSSAASVVQAIRAAVCADSPAVSDRELVRRFVEGDQDAFAVLVRRHGAMVLGVCRRALSHPQDAEDACQATFLVLIRQARMRPWQSSLASYLYITARQIAANVRLAARRRAKREERVAVPEVRSGLDQMTARELLAALDEELDRLPPRYRAPLVLCYLEGLGRDEAAVRLGVPPATLKSQLERGRKKLAAALTARGCALGAGLVALATSATAGVSPPRLVEAVLAAVSGSPPAAVAALAGGVSVKALMNRALCVLLAVMAVAWLGVGVWATRQTTAGAAGTAPPAKTERASPKAEGNKADAQAWSGQVVGPDGKPVAKASIVLAVQESEETKTIRELAQTDATGRFTCVVPPPGHWSHHRQLVARAAGFAADWVWLREAGPAWPLVLRLARATVPIRGRVLTLEGKPAPGAVIRLFMVQAPDGKNGLQQMYRMWTVSPNDGASMLHKRLTSPGAAGLPEKVTADAQGRFVIRGVGDGRVASLEFSGDTIETIIARVAVDKAFDPKAVRLDPRNADPELLFRPPGPLLYGPVLDHTARPCRVIHGKVFDRQTKKPLANVRITGRVPRSWPELAVRTRTDATGRYRLVGLPNAECRLAFGTVKPSTYLTLVRTVPPGEGQAPAALDMPMAQGTVVTGRVTDRASGRPIRGSVRYASLVGNKHLGELPGTDAHSSGSMIYHLDAAGRFNFVAPPGLGIILLQTAFWSGQEKAYPPARIRAEDRNKPYLRPGRGVFGEVIVTAAGGTMFLASYHGYRVIEPAVGTEKVTADLQLDAGTTVAGRVVGPDGKPFVGVTVSGLEPAFSRPAVLGGDTFTAQALLPGDKRTVFACHVGKKLAGSVQVREGARQAATLRLTSWGALTGRVLDADGEPIAGVTVQLRFNDFTAARLYLHLTEGRAVSTDAAGRYRCDVPFAGEGFNLQFSRGGKYLNPSRPQRGLSVESGQTKALGDIAVK
jgi:RNA polymerase sigma factor (sigma-70 family)